MSPSKETVVVTGFGLFGGYQVNSSWVAAKVRFRNKLVKLSSGENSVALWEV